ncbi:hypothetical protein PV326_002858 [Microctonus aethiopoides]|nr:hypothetical protein PV326_002858 [Microctonus aethiopoides]
MSFNVAIFFCFLANFLFSNHVYEAAQLPKPALKIADVIKNDKNVCDITSEIQHSQYLQECNKLEFPNNNFEVTKENVNQFLCIALYDSFVKICQYNNVKDTTKKGEINEISVWNNETVFDKAIEVINKNGDHDLWYICQQIKKLSPVYNKTSGFVGKLKSKFNNTLKCAEFCENDPRTIKPLLIGLYIINQKFDEKVIDNTEKKELIPIKLPANESNITNTNKLNEAIKNETNSPNQKTNLEQSKVIKDDFIIKNKPADNLHPQSREQNKQINDKEKHLTTTTTAMPKVLKDSKTNDNPSKKIQPLPVASNTSIATEANKNEKAPLSDITGTEKKDETPTANTQAATISDKTRNEEQTNAEYDLQMDNDQLAGPEDAGLPDDDPSRQQPKEISQLDDDVMEEKENPVNRLPSTHQEDDSHFFGYFTVIGLIGIAGCLIYHRKQKILAMIVEGRRSRGGRGRKRPSTASYRKLDCNLEEAVTSQCNSNVSHVIY